MAGDLYGLSAADRDVLLRMIAREKSNYTPNVRSLAPVPRAKIDWKASREIKWFWLKEPLYPQSDLSPYNDVVWQCEACETVWNAETKQWDSVYPEKLVTIYSTGNMYGMTDMVIPCQKRGDGWEPVASAPGDNVVLVQDPQSAGDWTSSSEFYAEETTRSPVDKSGFLRFDVPYRRFAYPGSYFKRPIDMHWASPSLNFETDGEIEVLYTGVYEITFAAQVAARDYAFASPKGRGQHLTNTGSTAAPTAHTHTFASPWDGYNPHVHFRPALWKRPVGGAYAEQSGTWRLPEIKLNLVGTARATDAYYGRVVQLLTEGETLGVKAYSDALQEARITLANVTLGFHMLQPGHAS